MAKHDFNGNDRPTLGVEIELQLVDVTSGSLSNRFPEVLDQVPPKWVDSIKPEFMQSYCELNTEVCNTVGDVERDLSGKLEWAQETAEALGLKMVWSGTHPFSLWSEQAISPGERYAWLMDAMQYIARRLVVFGLHVHVGVDTGDRAVHLCDRMLRHLPTLLALSANSPFWCGRDTGMASYRTKVMEALPTAGMPQTMRNWSEYVWLVNHLIDTNFIRSIREIWWEVLPHAMFGTVEVRIMDMPLNMRHLLGLVALTQSLIVALSESIDRGAYQFDCHPMIAKQNKWHAARYGMDATFVDFDTMLAVPARQQAKRLIELCTPHAQRLDCLDQLHYLNDIIDNGTGATRQKRVFEEAGRDSREVVQFLMEQQTTAVA
ncbi:MAG: carboxylate-amine ligase [Planctomycetota bacterium]|jgi:carboxylate-amine ligase